MSAGELKNQLPSRYYLAHAREVFAYVQNHCRHLLDDSAARYLEQFQRLSDNEQCMLIRILSRKPSFLKENTLYYPEIDSPQACLQRLSRDGFIQPVEYASLGNPFFNCLTKPELIEFLDQTPLRVKRSLKKADLVSLCSAWINENPNTDTEFTVIQNYVERKRETDSDYLLFLFFGDLRQGFEAFTMRDLGVLRTKHNATKLSPAARFDSFETAQLEYRSRLFKQQLKTDVSDPSEAIEFVKQNHHHKNEALDQLALHLGETFVKKNSAQALFIWTLCHHPQALEKRLRLQYSLGQTEEVKRQLEELRNTELSATSELFVEDFYARKFMGKRTSIYTDMLKEAEPALALDEVYVNSVEHGVLDHLKQHQQQAWYVENSVWKTCFGLLFWQLLYEQDLAIANEFDRLPLILSNGHFYSRYATQIENRLSALDHPGPIGKELTALVVRHHGYPNGIFKWSSTLLDTLLPLLKFSPPGALANVMRRMAKHYAHTSDGYPDLMVLHNEQLTFVEVKAPGDSLRPNQLVSINRLSKAGYNVLIQPVHWATNPNQRYCVVDIETTGSRQSGNAITEIAIVTVQNSEIIDEWSTLVKPDRPIPKYIMHLTGISNEMVSTAPIFAEIADELRHRLSDSIFVAHNVAFDYGFIKAAYQHLNQPFSLPRLCTVRGSRKAFPGLSSYSLGNLVQHFDIDLKNHHRALEDARATAHLLRLIQAK